MAINVTKPAINLREKLNEVTLETGIKGEELLNSDTSTEARNVLELDTHLFTDFESTGIDDNATSTAITIDASENVGIGVSPIGYYSSYDNLVVGNLTGSTGITIASSPANSGTLAFADGTATSAEKYRGEIGFSHITETLYLNTAGNQRVTIDTSGNTTVKTGNLVIGTSGKGIDFSAVSDGARSVSSNVLDDYEEGTWDATPSTSTTTLTPLSGWTLNQHVGYYVKVGKLVTVSWYFDWANTNTSSSTLNLILPFASASSNIWAGNGTEVSRVSFPSGATYVAARVESNNSYISFKGCGSNIHRVNMLFSNFGATANGYAIGSLSYFAA